MKKKVVKIKTMEQFVEIFGKPKTEKELEEEHKNRLLIIAQNYLRDKPCMVRRIPTDFDIKELDGSEVLGGLDPEEELNAILTVKIEESETPEELHRRLVTEELDAEIIKQIVEIEKKE